jgi:DNA replication protein DnaC
MNGSTDRSARRHVGAIAAPRHPRSARQPARRGARANLSARETLILLCEREIARKDHHRIEMALKLAHFPAVKELAGFDFEAQPSIDPKQIRDLAASRRIANDENVLLLGPPGVGKTHLSIALGREAIRPHTRCSSQRRRRWSLASPRRTASGAWTRNCWRCRSRSC